MSDAIKRLLDELIAQARQQGLSQGQLAEQAGLSAVGLSKAKGRGDLRASTLAALAEQVGLELALVPRRGREKATEAIRAGSFFRTTAGADGA